MTTTPVAATDDDSPFTGAPPSPQAVTPRVASLWAWPAAMIIVVAVIGQVLGTVGAACAAALVLSTAVFMVGFRTFGSSGRVWLVLLPLSVGLLAVVVLASSSVPMFRESGRATPGLRGVKVTQAMADRTSLRGADLSGADLTGLDLRRNSLAGAIVKGASLRRARLDGISLRGADLSGADLRETCLQGTDFSGAVLSGSQLDGAYPAPGAIDFAAAGASGRPAATEPAHCR
ncbi:pentapeptide repeat-containing protein [Dactylosporangium darangshiense]|uniref:pentapeptide repeat-containing protein n=1 Tax=Dactylosporangium darangshiense TaxID=579108 RepID=UPI0031E97658